MGMAWKASLVQPRHIILLPGSRSGTPVSAVPAVPLGAPPGMAGWTSSSGVSRPGIRSAVALPIHSSGLLLDTGDVLYDATGWWRWLVRLLSHMGVDAHYPASYRVWQRDYLCDVNCGRRDYWDALRDFLRGAGLSRGQITEALVAIEPRHRQFLSGIRPLPGVQTSLARLAASGIPLGVLSNSPYSRSSVIDSLTRLGIARYFSAVFTSIDLGFAARDARGYLAAASGMQVEATEMIFVGHNGDELAGAADAGMRTIAFNQDAEAQADVYLDHFELLAQVVAAKAPHLLAG